jgi:hypothetical protein
MIDLFGLEQPTPRAKSDRKDAAALGQMKDGRFRTVALKGPTGRLRPEQSVFLERIDGVRSVGFMAHNCRTVLDALRQGP